MAKKRTIAEVAGDGEDHQSFTRHNRYLQAEYKKARPNLTSVRQIMALTFKMRRADITTDPRAVSVVLQEYPFLRQKEEVCDNYGHVLIHTFLFFGHNKI